MYLQQHTNVCMMNLLAIHNITMCVYYHVFLHSYINDYMLH